MKKISILGSTGSIGLTTLKIIDKQRSFFKINLLSGNKNFNQICNQIKKYSPKIFVISDFNTFNKVRKRFNKKRTKILNDFPKIKFKSDLTISAISGIAGLNPTLHMIKNSKKILIANKESIICGWDIIKKDAKKYKSVLIPIDSEHFSILKLLENHNLDEIKKIYLTASGGPFLNYKLNKLKHVSPKDALKHPKWKMGKKVTIDSSTLMNKVLELIEAQKFFNIPKNKLDILIHPNSLVHAIIKLNNGLTKFIYHETSMIVPIANAIFDGNFDINLFFKTKKKIDKIQNLKFEEVNKNTFPIFKLKNRLNEYPSTSIIINAANEIFVDQFLQKKIQFLSFYKIILGILNDRNYKKYAIKRPININLIKKIDEWARITTLKNISKKK